jgi:deoxyguanosine kinase
MIVSLEGLPGAGKTTTAEVVAERQRATYVHERSKEHPFLAAFYSDVERYKLETELCFVLLHYHQYRDLPHDETVILDYSPVKDLVFADLNLSGEDYEVFNAVYQHTSGALALPDIAVFIDLSIEHTLRRIRERGRSYENDFDPEYLQRLRAAYERRFDELGERVERVQVEPDSSRESVADAVVRAVESH